MTRDSDNSGMKIWVVKSGKSPRLAEIVAKGLGNLEWVVWEEFRTDVRTEESKSWIHPANLPL